MEITYILQDSSQLRNWMIPDCFYMFCWMWEHIHYGPSFQPQTFSQTLWSLSWMNTVLFVSYWLFLPCVLVTALLIMGVYFRNLWNVRYILPFQQILNCRTVASSGIFISFFIFILIWTLIGRVLYSFNFSFLLYNWDEFHLSEERISPLLKDILM